MTLEKIQQQLAVKEFTEELDNAADSLSSACSILEHLGDTGSYPFPNYSGYRVWVAKLNNELVFLQQHIKKELV